MASDFTSLWQKDKPFWTFLGGGLALFLVGETAIGYLYRDDLEAARVQIRAERKELGKKRANRANLEAVEAVHRRLQEGIAAVEGKVQFQESPEFQLAEGAASPENQYFDIVTRIRERLVTRAHHNNIEVPDSLGLPAVSPTGKEEIRRTLRGLDLVQRAVGLAIDLEVDRVEEIRIEPEARAKRKEGEAGKGGASIDTVRVRMRIAGSGHALAGFLEATQTAGRPLLMERCKLSASSRGDWLVGDLEFLALRFPTEEEKKK